ncbi:formylglycine-generating enzyme family protein [Roseofilum casamattae]|uniref:Formylglycine-generating enzyme family protein n=1 Tax=Roseofilum casamattae BLCC-M143 TaxID=3022442 RepID=A0ABT7BTH8_9CYAN|nr:formylglycine-generating enzyme family protein [Roseofilum casamattae]MDJ1182488.1 formylglycine-generating enzyme family protein [Roseofilum casamattae BLCC-M143]
MYFAENLREHLSLEMVKIPPGTFMMGSPDHELERLENEWPYHEVTVGEFFCGRYPITQGQWRVIVESTKPIERELNPDPSLFKDNYKDCDRWSRPVECISWYDAQEFCARLRQKTG